MPFRRANAAAELQPQVNRDFLAPITERWMVLSVHGVLVSRNAHEHLEHFRQALELLREKQLYFKAQKCSFFMQTIGFLGYRISAAGVVPNAESIEAIPYWPLPVSTGTEVQKFLGGASYYRNFIRGFAKIVAALTSLLKKHRPLLCRDAEDKAAKTLIPHLTSAPVLALAGFDKHSLLITDASDEAVRVMISQQPDESKTPYCSMRFSSLCANRVPLPSAREGALRGLAVGRKVSTLLVRKTFHLSNRPPVIDALEKVFRTSTISDLFRGRSGCYHMTSYSSRSRVSPACSRTKSHGVLPISRCVVRPP